jgi:tetratricopeptide (TPR) repeat protein
MPEWSRRPALVGAGVAALVLAVYARTAGHSFVNVDDQLYLYENPHVLQGLTWRGIAWAFTTFRAGNWHPLTWLSHMADVEVLGLAPGRHHLAGAALHAVNAVLLFLLLRRATGATWRSAAVAALFGVHPLRAESVAWASERKDVLSALLLLLSLLAWLRYATSGRRRFYAASLALLALGLLAKPMLVSAPLLLLLLDFWPLGRMRAGGAGPRAGGLRALVLEKVPFFVLAVASSAVTWGAQAHGEATVALAAIPFPERLANALVTCMQYLADAVWPSGLAFFYPHPAIAGPGTPSWQAGLAALALAAATALAIRERVARPYLLWGWLWYLVSLVPVMGLVQVGTQARADRYTYLPLIGVMVAAVWGAGEALGRLRAGRAAAWAAGLAAVGAFAVLGFRQVGTWRDSQTLHRHALAVTERSWNAWLGLGDALLEQGRLEESISANAEALRILPGLPEARNGVGVAQGRMGRHEEAMQAFREALRLRPTYADAWYNLGTAYGALGQHGQAAACFAEALRLRPDDPRALENLGVASVLLGDRARAQEAVERLRALDAARAARLARLLAGGGG